VRGRAAIAAARAGRFAPRRPRLGRAVAGALAVLGVLPVRLAAAADPARGERVFQRCYACHSVVAGEEDLPGPSLRCVIGRRAGSLAGFEYSPALRAAGGVQGLVWTRGTLEAFLRDPHALVPGTTMTMPALPAADDRRDVIDYLERAGACPAGRAPGSRL
jgi:cytochrome c